MATNLGTLVIAPIRPFDGLDTYASAYANEIKGGLHIADVLSGATTGQTQLYDITIDRRLEGMVGVATSTMITYQLSGGTSNSNWVEFSGGAGVDYLGELLDVNLSAITDGQALIFSGGTWINENIDSLYEKGGFRNVQSIVDRNSISFKLRREGMVVGVHDTGNYYKLLSPPWIGTNDDWGMFNVSGTTNVAMSDLTDVYLTGTTTGDILVYSGGTWVNIKYEMISSGETRLFNNTTTNFAIGDTNIDRGILIDYTLSRSGSTNTFQLGTITILYDDFNTHITNLYQSTSSLSDEFVIFDTIINLSDIMLSCIVNNELHDVIMVYHIRTIKKVDF